MSIFPIKILDICPGSTNINYRSRQASLVVQHSHCSPEKRFKENNLLGNNIIFCQRHIDVITIDPIEVLFTFSPIKNAQIFTQLTDSKKCMVV